MVKKIAIIIPLLTFSVFLTSYKKPAQTVLKTVIIDAGHGLKANGRHDGATGSFSHEDQICFEISKKLVAAFAKTHPEIRVVETRPTENIVDLRERANIANRERGDLFISIHVNAMPPITKKTFVGYKTEVYYTGKGKSRKKRTRKVPQYRYTETPNTWTKGTETYIWGAHKSEDKELAVRENAAMLMEDNYQTKYGDVDPNSAEFVAFALAKTKQYTFRSAAIAGFVEDEFEKVGRISAGKKQRQVGIWVLQATAMPSILVETGFITNPEEEKFLNSEQGQNQIVGCVNRAVDSYIDWLQKKQLPMNLRAANTPQDKPTLQQTEAFLQSIDNHERKRVAGR